MTQQVYRSSNIGECLRASLFDLMENRKITEEVAEKILCQFDKSMYSALSTNVQTRASFKGSLKTYRYVDNVWTFFLEDITLKLNNGSRGGSGSDVKMASAKLVCVDSKLVQSEEKQEWEGHPEGVPEMQRQLPSQSPPMTSILTKTEADILPGVDDSLKEEHGF